MAEVGPPVILSLGVAGYCSVMRHRAAWVKVLGVLLIAFFAYPAEAKVPPGWKPPVIAATGSVMWGSPMRGSGTIGLLFQRLNPGLIIEGEIGFQGKGAGVGWGWRSPDTPGALDVLVKFSTTGKNPMWARPHSQYLGLEAAAALRPVRIRAGLHRRVRGHQGSALVAAVSVGLMF